MSDLDDSFTKLLGRQPSDTERQHLYRVREALGLKNNDALWLILMALQHYDTMYSAIPASIKDAAQKAAGSAAAQAQAEVNKAVAALVPTVEAAISKAASVAVSRVQLGNSMWTLWLGMVSLAFMLGLGWVLGAHIFTSAATGHITWSQFFAQSGWGIGIGTAVPGLLLIFMLSPRNDGTEWWHWLAGLLGLGGCVLLALGFAGYFA